MGKTSAAVKNRYNAKNYDRLNIIVPKGEKETLKALAASLGESLNEFVNRAVDARKTFLIVHDSKKVAR